MSSATSSDRLPSSDPVVSTPQQPPSMRRPFRAARLSRTASRARRIVRCAGKLFNFGLVRGVCSFASLARLLGHSPVRPVTDTHDYLSLPPPSSLVSHPRRRSPGSHGINYPRPKPHVVARGHSRESARRYTRVSRPYARVSVPSNLRRCNGCIPSVASVRARVAFAQRGKEEGRTGPTGVSYANIVGAVYAWNT